jgi:U3 small nucleolar RNA-associated protein 10
MNESYVSAMSGLEELINIDDVFMQYEETLFSASSQNYERAIQTKEMNQKLDANIEEFLIHLSPKILLRPAHKALEWLIHR